MLQICNLLLLTKKRHAVSRAILCSAHEVLYFNTYMHYAGFNWLPLSMVLSKHHRYGGEIVDMAMY